MLALLSPCSLLNYFLMRYKHLQYSPYLWLSHPPGKKPFSSWSTPSMGMQDPQPTWRNQLAHECKATSAFCAAHIELPCSSCQGLNTSFPFNRHFQTSIRCWVCWDCLVCGELSFPSRHQIALCCWLPHLSSTWVEKPPLATPSSALCHSLIFCLIWYSLRLCITGMFLLWSTNPRAPQAAVFLQLGGSRFRLGRQGEGWYRVSISVHLSRASGSHSAVHGCCLANTEKFHFFPLVLNGFTWLSPALGRQSHTWPPKS